MHNMGDWGSWWALMWLAMIVGWIVVIAVIWLIFAALRSPHNTDMSEDVLARRLARGEITREEYRATLAELRRARDPGLRSD